MIRLLLILGLICSGPVTAEPQIESESRPEAQAKVETSWPLSGLEGVSGVFLSSTRDATGSVVTESRGRFASIRPDHFLWEVTAPDSQLFIVNTDGFWQWDRDLEVVIARDLPASHEFPLGSIWKRQEQLDELSARVGRGEFSGLSNLTILSSGPDKIEMTLVDALARETIFELIVESNIPPVKAEFEFNLPPNVEFYDERTGSSERLGLGGI